MTKQAVQTITSANTSINKNKLPASTKKIPWAKYQGLKVLDVGGGKFDNLKDYLWKNFQITLFVYDKYNRSEKENNVALCCEPHLVICNNVLNVIKEDQEVMNIRNLIVSFEVPFYISVYEGDKSGIGKVTKKDCYQRNQRLEEYRKFFPFGESITKGMIHW